MFAYTTRMHTSGMCTACLLTISQHALLGGCTCLGVYLPGGRGTCLEGVPALGGCVPAGGCTCLGVYLPGVGVGYQPGGVYLPGGVPAQGVYLPRGVNSWGGVPAWGVYLLGVVYLARYSPLWTDRHM